MRTALALALVVPALVACQGESGGEVGEEGGGRVATTARALAWLAADHLGEPSVASAESDAAEEFGRGGVGAELSFGQQVVLAVGHDLPPRLYDCGSVETEGLGGCVNTDDGVLMWELEAPEEDPGVIYVVVPKGDSAVLMFSSGPQAITGDPRELDLPVSVADLFELANDPRVDVTTTQEAVDGGRDLDYWGQPDL